MSLIKADLGLVRVSEHGSDVEYLHPPQQSHPLSPLHEPLHGQLNAIRKYKCFLCNPFYGRACRRAMLGELKPKGPKGPRPDPWAAAIDLWMVFLASCPLSIYAKTYRRYLAAPGKNVLVPVGKLYSWLSSSTVMR